MSDGPPPLRVVVVGPGGWGQQHTRVFAGRPDTSLAGIVGRDASRTTARAADLGTTGYTDLDRMLDEARPDLITVSLPNEEHFEPTLRLLETGIPLLVEKPLVFDLDEADALLAAAAASASFFAIDFNHRYAEPVQRTRRALDEGRIGDPVFATWRFGGEPNLGATPHKNLIETQCHAFDMLEHLLGPISSVVSQSASFSGTGSTVALALSFANGAVGTLLGSYDSSYAYPGTHLLEVNGTSGRAVVVDTVQRFELSRVGDTDTTVWQAGYFDDSARSFAATFDRYVDDLLRALRAGSPPPVPATAGRRALFLARCAIESAESGRRVATT
ncbi:Gfo/Idh/MocA family protein [Frondihabitans australicus]|uniref:Putative dehydrogenase n=1 Tax=Frondihabitans australicus TaxID=386892 RepID=A0A495IJ29_9MICO|nr:Gfo/Idh/MocA family oxidoreductase [Frondihabitans australicus]RKR75301.1 putative dehydrogenase [Frondihabitans australicus]